MKDYVIVVSLFEKGGSLKGEVRIPIKATCESAAEEVAEYMVTGRHNVLVMVEALQ